MSCGILPLLHMELGKESTIKELQKKFKKIDEEDGMENIIGKRYKIRGE